MGFESGTIGVRMYYVPGGFPRDCVARFASEALPPLDSLGREDVRGWVTGRHLLDRRIVEDTAFVAGYLRLTLVKAERKIPEALMRAECRMLELAEIETQEGAPLTRTRRAEIRKEVVERMLPTMPPTLSAVPIVYDADQEMLYAGALSEQQSDALVISLRQTLGKAPTPLTAETAALKRKQCNARDLKPTSFSDNVDDAKAGDSLGQDFLTWLWFFSEQKGGILTTDRGRFAVAIEGPLTFVFEGEGAHVTQLSKGMPLVSAEAKTALLSGKKLSQARVLIARDDDAWQFSLGAEQFILRGIRLPKGEQLDAVSRFQERMMALDTLQYALLAFFDRFVDDRFGECWPDTCGEIRQWVAGRVGRV